MFYCGLGISIEQIKNESLDSSLSMATVAEIKDIITRLQLPVKKSGKKENLIGRVVYFLKTNPKYLVNRLSLDEIEFTQRIIKGEHLTGDMNVLHNFYILVQLGWILLRETEIDSDIAQPILIGEAEELLAPLIMEADREDTDRRIHRLVTRWGALCGLLPIPDIVEYFKTFPGLEHISEYRVISSVERFDGPFTLFFEHAFNNGNGCWVYGTAWGKVTNHIGSLLVKDEVIDGVSRPVNIYSPKRFSPEEINAVGMPLFGPKTPNAIQRDKVISVCRKYGYDEYMIDRILLQAWEEKQIDKESLGIDRLLKMIPYKSIEQLNEFMGAIQDYMNTVPFWRFLGQSSKELATSRPIDKNHPPKLVAGPNMRAMGLDITPEMERMYEQMMKDAECASRMPEEQSPIGLKVGRNDSCPCGSGKKYKHCCGR